MSSYLHALNEDRYDAITTEYLKYVEAGLPKTDEPKHIGIIGAGVAGLVAGTLLKQAGHQVDIFEAQRARENGGKGAGGRVETFRNQFEGDLYIEAGAMRLPTDHKLLQAYIKKLCVPVRPFYNRSVDPGVANEKPTVDGFDMEWLKELDKTYAYVNGVPPMRRRDTGPDTARILNYPVDPAEHGKTAEQLLAEALNPLREYISADPDHPVRNWKRVIDRYGEYSLRHFLKEVTWYSEGAIEMIGVLTNHEARMMLDFMQSFLETAIINPDTRFVEIVGGADKLVDAYLPFVGENIHYEHVLQKLEWNPDGGRGATLHMTKWYNEPRDPVEVDEVIVTVPFTSMRMVDTEPFFSHGKRKAIRELHYDAATKVMLQFDKRFWEDDGIYGGGSITDLPNRNIYYPASGFGGEGGGVVLAAYCWSDDARKWDSLLERERKRLALQGLKAIHGPNVEKYVSRKDSSKDKDPLVGASKSWMQDPFIMGEAAMFTPGQLALLQPDIVKSEGNVHFAGEHTSLKHAWIEGAIESGIRTALAVNDQEGPGAGDQGPAVMPWQG